MLNGSTLPNRMHLINIGSTEMVNGSTCTLPDRTYLINIGLIVTLVIQITSAVVYQFLSMTTKSAKRGVGGALTESLSFGTCLVYYSIFLILKLINPSTYPVHWVILTGIQSAWINFPHKLMCDSVCMCDLSRKRILSSGKKFLRETIIITHT